MLATALLSLCCTVVTVANNEQAQREPEKTLQQTAAEGALVRVSTSLSGFTDVLVDGENCRGAHVSTRPHNRKVVYHATSGTWFVFHGTGHWTEKLGDAGSARELIAWRASKDGETFSPLAPAMVGNGHSSSTDVLMAGDRVFATTTRWGFWRQKAGQPVLLDGKPIWHRDRMDPEKPNFYVPFEIFPFDVVDGRLVGGTPSEALPGDRHIGHAGPHYGSLTRDTNGHLWVAARALARADGRLATWVARTVRPDDTTAWEPHTVLFESAGPGTHAPQILALDEGRVACVLFAKHERMTAVYLHNSNSRTWSNPNIVGKGYQSKRACASLRPRQPPSPYRLHRCRRRRPLPGLDLAVRSRMLVTPT